MPVDIDAFIAVHEDQWDRLDELSRKRRLTGAEADEMIRLYQTGATHLSMVRSEAPDPHLVARLSTVLNRARRSVTGTHLAAWRQVGRFFSASFPAALYRARWWCIGMSIFAVLVAFGTAIWISGNPETMNALVPPDDAEKLVNHQFVNYYFEHEQGSFAAKVWTNNAWISAQCVAFGITGVWPLWVMFQNALNIGISGGIMHAYGGTDVFFAYILPHGLLELTAIFVAGGAGLRIFWAWVAPGRRTRLQALAEDGRALMSIALGLVVVLFVSGLVEGFITPSGWPTPIRVGIGFVVWAVFIAYAWVLGKRATEAGETGDVEAGYREDVAPAAG